MATDYAVGLRYRLISDWCNRSGTYYAGWPTFNSAKYSNPNRTVYGHLLLKDEVVDWRDVLSFEYRNALSARDRLTGAHDYARRQGYQHGFPNFHQANRGNGIVYGTYLIPPGVCEFRDVPAWDLGLGFGDPATLPIDRWIRGAHDYAWPKGFGSGMPTGHRANYGNGYVCGVFLFPQGKVTFMDIRGREIGLPDYVPPSPPSPKPPTPPTPQPPATGDVSFWLDFNPMRITRIGTSSVFSGRAVQITSVENRSGLTVELGIRLGDTNTILASAVVPAGESTGTFNGYNANANWGGVVRGQNVNRIVGPFVVHFKYL